MTKRKYRLLALLAVLWSRLEPAASVGVLLMNMKAVAVVGLVTAAIGYAFLLFRGVTLVAGGHTKFLGHPSFLLHVAASTLFLGVWLLCRGGTQSHRFVRSAEALGLVLGCGAYQLMALFIPNIARPEMIMILALSYGLFARAIYVPSTPLRTATNNSRSGSWSRMPLPAFHRI